MTRMAEPARALRFTKMHGAGNDFVVLDHRVHADAPSPALCRALADRRFGVGCDQILTIERPCSADAVAAYGIWNADGSPARQCGNGARCVAAWLVREGAAHGPRFVLESPTGLHAVDVLEGGTYRVAMGVPDFRPTSVPLRGFDAAQLVYALDLPGGRIDFGALSMGNPHAVIEVDDVGAAPVDRIGPALQSHAAFPDSVNVGFAQVVARDCIRLRVFERGVGETLACGSGACAAAAALMQRGRIAREVDVRLAGGTLRVAWPDPASPLTMAGPTAFVFEGAWPLEHASA